MGNSASALPYKIGDETHPPSRPGSYGFAIHNGNRKSDNLPVTVFKGSKSTMAQTPLVKGSNVHDPSLTQLFPALHHFQKTKTLIHPNILKVYATLDTDFPNDGKDSNGSGGSAASTPGSSIMSYGAPMSMSKSKTVTSQVSIDSINPKSLSALEQTPTTGDLIIVTEPVIPLSTYLDSLQNDDSLTDLQRSNAVAWGLYNIITAITFLHTNAKVCHGNLSPYSIYVTPAGDFKLSGLQLLTPIGIADGASGPTPHFRHFERDVTNNMYRSPERIEGRWDAISNGNVHAMDAYSLGMLLPELYAHVGCGTRGRLPQKLEKACKRLSSVSMTGRPRIGPLVRCPVFDSEYIKTLSFLDTLATQDVETKITFWQKLPDLLGSLSGSGSGSGSMSAAKQVLSSRVARYKILPLLQSTIIHLTTVDNGLTQDVNKRECLALLPTLFSTSTTYLTPQEFQLQLSPVVELLFRVNDRAVRGSLLSRITLFSKLLDSPTLNKVVFEPMCSGFSDSSAPLRELTLKSAIVLVEFLTPANLEKLTRYLVRLQGDSEDSIRTNTVIFIGKVAPNLSEMARAKLILPAFMRAMGDGFVPCRLAGLKAICACREYFEERKLATDVLPVIAPSLVDSNEDVRMESMKVVGELLEILRDLGDRMREEERARLMIDGGGGSSASSFTGGTGVAAAGGSSRSSSVGTMVGMGSKGQSDTTAAAASSSYLSGFSSWATSKISSSSTTTTTKPTTEANSTVAPTSTSSYTAAAPIAAPKPAPKFSSLTLRDAGVGGVSGNNGWSKEDDDFGDLDIDSPEKDKGLIPSWASENDNGDFMSQFEKKDFIRPRSAVGVGSSKLGGGGTPSRVAAASRRRAELVQKKNKETKVSVKKLAMDNSLDDGWDDF